MMTKTLLLKNILTLAVLELNMAIWQDFFCIFCYFPWATSSVTSYILLSWSKELAFPINWRATLTALLTYLSVLKAKRQNIALKKSLLQNQFLTFPVDFIDVVEEVAVAFLVIKSEAPAFLGGWYIISVGIYVFPFTKFSPSGCSLKYSSDKLSLAGNSFSSKFVVFLNSSEIAKSHTAQSFWK